jgi:hypothetical protein
VTPAEVMKAVWEAMIRRWPWLLATSEGRNVLMVHRRPSVLTSKVLETDQDPIGFERTWERGLQGDVTLLSVEDGLTTADAGVGDDDGRVSNLAGKS